MPKPAPIPGCPQGLEYLASLDQIFVVQNACLLEAFTDWETNNKYALYNKLGQQFLYAMEETDCCMRQCCGPYRGFTIHVVDNTNTVKYMQNTYLALDRINN
jgi:hypothetical protein